MMVFLMTVAGTLLLVASGRRVAPQPVCTNRKR